MMQKSNVSLVMPVAKLVLYPTALRIVSRAPNPVIILKKLIMLSIMVAAEYRVIFKSN